MNDSKEIAVQNNALLELAISKDLDTEKLEKLIDLKAKEEDRQCKKDFDFHFAEMQKEFTPIKKTKKAYSSTYAPLEEMENQFRSIITKHGFSYRWREQAIESGKRVTIIISGWGHTDDQCYFDVPELKATNQMNAVQVEGAKSTYGKRYTFKAGFGITETDEDTDGNFTFEEGVKYASDINLIRTAKTVEQLKENFQMLFKKFENDETGRALIVKEKNKRKAEL